MLVLLQKLIEADISDIGPHMIRLKLRLLRKTKLIRIHHEGAHARRLRLLEVRLVRISDPGSCVLAYPLILSCKEFAHI